MKLALGTVQFGLDYGVTNTSGQVPPQEVGRILACAREAGMDTLDTAIGYGDSEARLGQAGVEGWKVVTKLPGLPAACPDVGAWVAESVEGSLQRLGIPQLYGLLLHRPADLSGAQGETLHAALEELRSRQVVQKIGVSIYDPGELEVILPRYSIQLVQAPYNVFDRRLETSGALERMQAARIEVHTRSAFLQGLLFLKPEQLPEKFRVWNELWLRWHSWLADKALTPLEGALGFALRARTDRVLVGVDSAAQLQDIVRAAQRESPSVPSTISSEDEALLNPSRWNAL